MSEMFVVDAGKRQQDVNITGGSLSTTVARPSTGGQSTVSVTASNTTVLSENTNRLGATMWNEGSADCYLKLGSTASTTSYTVKMAVGGYFEVPYGYTGVIDAITSAGSATLRVSELT